MPTELYLILLQHATYFLPDQNATCLANVHPQLIPPLNKEKYNQTNINSSIEDIILTKE
jgi:hypothetical protein